MNLNKCKVNKKNNTYLDSLKKTPPSLEIQIIPRLQNVLTKFLLLFIGSDFYNM
jgi:hypothetical protein